MHRFLHRYLLLPAFESGLKRRKVFRYWKELDRSQWLPAKEIYQLQFEALRHLVSHTWANCTYYRQAWAERGLGPEQLQAPEDFHRWPLLSREAILENRLRMRARVPGMRLLSKSTGGSSGVPLHFDLDTESNERRTAACFRGYSWAGAEPGTKQLHLWGGALGSRSPWKACKDYLYHYLYRSLYLSTFDLSDDRLLEYFHRLNRYKPDVIVAYTSALYMLARTLQARGLRPFSPRSIVVGAEKLHLFQRELIEKVFQAPVFETYGSREVMLIGAECERRVGLHLTAENLLVEVLDDNGQPTSPGEEGNVVVTDLYNYGMPFIRYRNGDRAVAGWATCPCGRGLPLMKKVVGRRLDVLQTPDGRRIPGEFFPHLMKDFPAVKRFQVVQQEQGRIRIQMVLGANWQEADGRELEQEVCKVTGPSVRIDFIRVDDIPLTGAGKLQVVVNCCSLPQARQAPTT
jgi:phenylacetate-CoA ligase